MRLIPLAGLALLLAVVPPRPALSAPWDGQPKLLLHVRSPIVQSPCANHGALGDCVEAVTSGGLTTPAEGPYYFVYLLAARGTSMTGVAEVRCGIDYQGGVAGAIGDRVGIDVLAWRLCATIDNISTGAPEWPRPGGGITIGWDLPESCQEGEAAVAGYFYIGAYSADVLRIAAEPVSGIASLRNCQSALVTLDTGRDLGSATFSSGGSENGCNPCDIACDDMTVLPSTWGGIKSLLN